VTSLYLRLKSAKWWKNPAESNVTTSPTQNRVESTYLYTFCVGRGGEGVERDFPRTLSPCHPCTPSHSLSFPLPPSLSLSLSLLVPVTLNPEGAFGGGDPLFNNQLKGAGRGRGKDSQGKGIHRKKTVCSVDLFSSEEQEGEEGPCVSISLLM